ncbi:bifunctional adenosylcobinamide kinase/adenosylcobinamide-phosphate guanylyltransferase [Pseudoalteromonas sp. C2R02]|uniref:bifunctional adenosylcobinamide kinase/adenosylcobinamide-phosphate guanylyltransferase n=1 Tax=Pseudoalteromonas sp. C2R02 TaxID=2841565 RepID=UPI001C09959C|nr:bifunctional adenosylcobinamide kinase/adenosylcobinamide-phosphate guanylyltransferase [Pseudoalteromonas sp. C2R02]MBU2968604.1 bifunctional adenosylcobinamide kinase/adenosylcobinamide-phosphate guanylyltransferase [Pseudoalteromonas sp. C2R02]
MKQLILGGVRSGKSSHAEKVANQLSKNVIYVATAQAFDDEMKNRILRHQNDRPGHWQLVEEPLDLERILLTHNQIHHTLLIDCLTLWLNNCLHYKANEWQQFKTDFLHALSQSKATIILVSNEVGFSITPDNALARVFCDEQGWLNQDIAKVCDRVTLTVAGIALELKNE